MIASAIAIIVAVVFATGDVARVVKAEGGVNFVMESVIRVDPAAETVTLPVFQGSFAGSPVYYIVTESSNKLDAERRKVN